LKVPGITPTPGPIMGHTMTPTITLAAAPTATLMSLALVKGS